MGKKTRLVDRLRGAAEATLVALQRRRCVEPNKVLRELSRNRFAQAPTLGWTAARCLFNEPDYTPLVTRDGRVVLFKRRKDAQAAALMHVRDGFDGWAPILDKMEWLEVVQLSLVA